MATMLVVGCSDAGDPAPLDPALRAVRFETTGCGFASGRTGSGVAVGDGLVITVAHLVVRADGITAHTGAQAAVAADVVAVDLARDLALLRVPHNEMPDLAVGSLEAGGEGRIVGAAATGDLPFVVEEVVTLTIEEVLGTDRHDRLGYKLAAATAAGDSGAGAYDEEDRLIGIVFATSQDAEATWLTSSVEIEDFLAVHEAGGTPLACDPAASRLG